MQELSKVYLDFNATTPISEKVAATLIQEISNWGNPSSIHWAGRLIKTRLRESRALIARSLGASPLELIFTSGASEANNTILLGLSELVRQNKLPAEYAGRNEFISSEVEHPSVEKTLQELESRGFTVHRISVSRDGFFDLEKFKSKLSSKTLLVSVMMANNETGNILPLPEICQLGHAAGALVHTDATQALGKLPFSLADIAVDYASLSAHKFHAPKGLGVLYVRKSRPFKNLIFGGAQERARRGGTENTLGQIAFATALSDLGEQTAAIARMTELRDKMETQILSEISDVTVTGGVAPRLPNTSALVVKGVDGESLLMSMDLRGFAISTGAACSSGSPEPSPVLLAMGLTRGEAQNSLRISMGWTTTQEQIEKFVVELKAVVARLRQVAEEERQRHETKDTAETQSEHSEIQKTEVTP